MLITIRHQLSIPVGSGNAHTVQHLLLTPISGSTQTVRDWAIEMPGIDTAARFTDAFGNRAVLVSQTRQEGSLAISVTGSVETQDRNGVLGRATGEPVVALFKRVTPLTGADDRIVDGFRDADGSSGRIALFHGIMARIGELYRFEDAEDELVPELHETGMQSQSQDGLAQSQSQSDSDAADERETAAAPRFAHAFVGAVRALGLPARYVTGFLAAGEDHPAAFHAWAEAYDDRLGWIGFDAALGLCPTDRHVRVAAGLDARATLPVRAVPQIEDPVFGIDVVDGATQ